MPLQIQLPTRRVLIVEDDPPVQLGIEQALLNYDQLTLVTIVDDGYLAEEVLDSFASRADAYCIKGRRIDILMTAIA
ncbi:MAG: hypothetical protein AAFX95_21990 [Cyanobacteria bacterium J06639_16]